MIHARKHYVQNVHVYVKLVHLIFAKNTCQYWTLKGRSLYAFHVLKRLKNYKMDRVEDAPVFIRGVELKKRVPKTPEEEKYAYDVLARMFEDWRERMKR